MNGLKLRKIVGMFALVLCAASVLVAHVWKQNAYVRLSLESVRLSKESARLRNGIALLELEAGDLRRLSRIESLAKGRFGLEIAKTPVPVYPEGRLPGGEAWAAEGRGGRTRVARDGAGLEAGKVTWQTRGL